MDQGGLSPRSMSNLCIKIAGDWLYLCPVFMSCIYVLHFYIDSYVRTKVIYARYV